MIILHITDEEASTLLEALCNNLHHLETHRPPPPGEILPDDDELYIQERFSYEIRQTNALLQKLRLQQP